MQGHDTPSPRKRLAIAPRVSTADQEAYGTSLDDQTLKGRLYAQLYQYTVVETCIYGGDESGALDPLHRPLLQRMLADARAGLYDAIVFHKIDRIARRLKYILEIWDLFEQAGVAVLIVDPGIDTSTPTGRAIRNMLATLAELEHETIKERTQGGFKARLSKKIPWGRKYGYTYVKRDRGKGTEPHVLINKEEAEHVRFMARRRAQSASYDRIAAELTAAGVANPDAKHPGAWHGRTVRRILSDPAYKGQGEWGVTQKVRNSNGKRSNVLRRDGRAPRPMDWPPILSLADWDAAHAVGQCAVTPVRATPDRYLFYGGMVRCAEHDRTMSGYEAGNGHRRYRCRIVAGGAHTKATCHSVPGADLEAAVWGQILAFFGHPERAYLSFAAGMTDVAQRKAALIEQCADLEQQIAWQEAQGKEALRQRVRNAIDDAMFDAMMAETNAEKRRLAPALIQAQAQLAVVGSDVPSLEEIWGVCRAVTSRAAEMGPQERRDLLELLQVEVQVTGTRYRVTGCIPSLTAEGELEAPGSAVVRVLAERACCGTSAQYPRSFVLTGQIGA